MTRSRDIADQQKNLGGAVAPFVAGKNKIINGDFSVWQRGTSIVPTAGNATYTADRWFFAVPASTTISRQAFTPGSAPVTGYESPYYLNATITANAQNYEMGQRVEDARTFANQTVTLSFWARSTVGAQPLGVAIFQNFGTGGTPSSLAQASVISSSVGGGGTYTPTSTWTRYWFTFSIPSVSGKTFGTNNDSFLLVRPLQFTTTTTNTSVDIWGVQLESGSVATQFTTATGTISGEKLLCLSYFERVYGYDSPVFGFGTAISTTTAWIRIIPTVPKRIVNVGATVSSTTGFRLYDGVNSAPVSTNVTLTSGLAALNDGSFILVVASTGLTQYRPYFLIPASSTNSYIDISAEL